MKLSTVANRIFNHAPLPDLSSLGSTSRTLRALIKTYLLRRINDLFGEWVEDPVTFRSIMDQTSTVLSGSTVLEFALAASWGCKDLDLYAPAGESCNTIVQYLRKAEGYRLDGSWGGDSVHESGYNPAQIKRVVKLVKTSSALGEEDNERYIDVIESLVPHPLPPILRFHTSFAMNWVASGSIFITYPQLTFAKKGILNERMDMTKPKQLAWMEKYKTRGFIVMTDTTDLGKPCGSACPTIWRSTRDIGCMVVSFGEDEADGLMEARWTLTKNGFTPRTTCNNPLCPQAQVLFERRIAI